MKKNFKGTGLSKSSKRMGKRFPIPKKGQGVDCYAVAVSL